MENQGRRSPPPVESPEPASGVPKKRPWSKPTVRTIGEVLSETHSGVQINVTETAYYHVQS